MKTVSFDEARATFERVFNLAAAGELVVIARDEKRVAVRCLPNTEDVEVAPPGYFANDYNADEVDELNALAAQG